MDEPVSKSQRKREAEALQKMGVALVDLSLAKLDALPLTEPLRQAIIDAKSITSHGAKRRQAQLIGKLLRAADHEAILSAYELSQEEGKSNTAHFHEVEAWRDRLINEGKEALTEFINLYQPDDIQQLRQLQKKAIAEQQHHKNLGAATALFRYIRSSLK